VLVEGGDILLVTGEAVEGFRNDDVESAGAGVLQQLLVARPKPAGAGAGRVAVGREERPALAVDTLAADPLSLPITRSARIYGAVSRP
jgi:hypothetical protein